MAKQYQEGDTVYVKIKHQTYTFATDTWADADPDATFPKVTILDPNGLTKVDAVTMNKKADGKFEYLYELPSSPETGWWKGYIDVENGSYPDREWFGFYIKE